MKKISIPVVVEPGSQPADEDGVVLDYMRMPSETWTYSMPVVPEPEEIDGLEDGIAFLQQIADALSSQQAGDPATVLPVATLDEANTELLDQVLGSGEVSIVFDGMLRARIQEAVLAGVWRVQYMGDDDQVERDVVEVGAIPSLIREGVFPEAAGDLAFDADNLPAGVGNAPSLLVEIADKLPGYEPGADPYVINLSLLPNSDEDLDLLATTLGSGPAVILSRGYGNCRITSTATKNVWWVQYFNSQDTLILNTIEISQVPEVACAAQEDIDDSAERLTEILDVYR
jgi:hydrogenase-1 operon protein HyaF